MSGQYRIGRLDSLNNRYSQPISDYAHNIARVRPNSLEAELLEGCKQAQIGTWLQTTEALNFEDPATGNRIIVTLDPSRAHIDINGRELSSCVSDEIENRQYDIGSMTNTWALVLFILSLGMGAWSWFGWEAWRRQAKVHESASAEPEAPRTAESIIEAEPPIDS